MTLLERSMEWGKSFRLDWHSGAGKRGGRRSLGRTNPKGEYVARGPSRGLRTSASPDVRKGSSPVHGPAEDNEVIARQIRPVQLWVRTSGEEKGGRRSTGERGEERGGGL